MEPWEDESCWTATRKEKKAIMGHFKADPGGPVDAGLAGTSIKNAQNCVYRVEMRKFVFIGLPSALGR